MNRSNFLRATAVAVLTLTVQMGASMSAANTPSASSDWNPAAFKDESTLEFLSLREGGRQHWSPVWLVVIDDQLYLRLGRRAIKNLESSTAYSNSSPDSTVRIAGREFEVSIIEANDMAGPVARAMAEKYPTDCLVRFFPHPLTARIKLRL